MMKRMIKKVLTVLTWVISLWVCLIFSFLTFDSSKKDIITAIITFVVMVALILFKIVNSMHKSKEEARIGILYSFLIISLFLFLLFRNHINFGYGDTLGILGYYTQLGILSMIGVSRTAAFIGLCVSYAAFCIAILLRCSLTEKISDKIKKIIITIGAIFGIISEVVGINTYFSKDRLSGVFILSVIVYIVMYFLLYIILKKKVNK